MAGQISEQELESIYTFAIQLGKDAGQMLLTAAEARYGATDGINQAQSSVEKDSSVDIVTQTDEGRLSQLFTLSFCHTLISFALDHS